MFEFRRLRTSAHRSIALSCLTLLLALTLSASFAAPAAAQTADGGLTSPGIDPGVTATGDENIDEWENDILNNPTPDTQEGFFDWLLSLLLDSLGLEHEATGAPGQLTR